MIPTTSTASDIVEQSSGAGVFDINMSVMFSDEEMSCCIFFFLLHFRVGLSAQAYFF